MLDLRLRVVKDRIVDPLVALIASTKVTPNQVSLAAFVVGLVCALAAACGLVWTAVLCWTVNRIMDGLDGAVARKTNQTSEFGGYLDIILDFTVYGLIPIGIVVGQDKHSPLCYIVMLLEAVYFVNAAGLFYLSALLEKQSAGAASRGEMTSVTMSPMPTALIEGSETVIAYFVFLLWPSYAWMSMSVFGVGVAVTILQRLHWARDNLDKQNATSKQR